MQRLAVRLSRNDSPHMSPLVVFAEADYQAKLDDITKKEDRLSGWPIESGSESRSVNLQRNPTGATALRCGAGRSRGAHEELAAHRNNDSG